MSAVSFANTPEPPYYAVVFTSLRNGNDAEGYGEAADAIEGRPIAYHRAVAAAFRVIAEDDPAGIARVDAIGAPEDVHARILAALGPLLNGAGA